MKIVTKTIYIPNFKEKNIGSAPIVDMEDNFLGVLSERDMAIKLVAEGKLDV